MRYEEIAKNSTFVKWVFIALIVVTVALGVVGANIYFAVPASVGCMIAIPIYLALNPKDEAS